MPLKWFESYCAGQSEQTAMHDDGEYHICRDSDGTWFASATVFVSLGKFKTENGAKRAARKHAESLEKTDHAN